MERCSEPINSCHSRISVERNITIHNNSLVVNKEGYVQDLKRFSSRIIFSDNVTRQNLNKKTSASNDILTADDDEQFFDRMRSEVDKSLSSHSNEGHEPYLNYQNTLPRGKKRVLDAETQNLIKRFKMDVKHINLKQSENNENITNSCNNNVLKQTHHVPRGVNQENIMHFQHLFSSNILDKNSGNPPKKCIFQVTSKLQKNVVPLATNETTIVHEEYEESLFYGLMFLTPPKSNLIENNEDS